jgi:hypothetical protein
MKVKMRIKYIQDGVEKTAVVVGNPRLLMENPTIVEAEILPQN